MYRFLLISLVFFAFSACSTVLDTSTQDIRVETPGAEGATCYLLRPGLTQKVFPPQTVKITKTSDDLTVRCTALGNREKSVLIENRFSDSMMLNIYNGLLPGIIYDYETGALFKFPDIIMVDFSDVLVKPMPLPDYQKFLMENPMIADLEEFRPGQAVLQRDRYEAVPTLQPRVPQSFSNDTPGSDMGGTGDGGAKSEATTNSSSAPTSISPAESLTRQMNPGVFDGGTRSIPMQNQGSGAMPVPVYPSGY